MLCNSLIVNYVDNTPPPTINTIYLPQDSFPPAISVAPRTVRGRCDCYYDRRNGTRQQTLPSRRSSQDFWTHSCHSDMRACLGRRHVVHTRDGRPSVAPCRSSVQNAGPEMPAFARVSAATSAATAATVPRLQFQSAGASRKLTELPTRPRVTNTAGACLSFGSVMAIQTQSQRIRAGGQTQGWCSRAAAKGGLPSLSFSVFGLSRRNMWTVRKKADLAIHRLRLQSYPCLLHSVRVM